MSYNQRFEKAVKFLISQEKTKNVKTFYESVGMDHKRYYYLAGKKGGEKKDFTTEEKIMLERRYPEIAWVNYVILGEEPMVLSHDNKVEEPAADYSAKVWQRLQIREIVAGASTLPQKQQIELLKEAYVELANELSETQEKIIQIQQISQGNLIDELKALIKRKR